MDGLLDTKKEYIDHLVDILIIPISQKIYSLYEECIRDKKNLTDFQKKLINIKNWNNNIIKEEYENIKKKSKCNYIPKLLKSIFIISIKIKIYDYKNKLKLKSPSVEDFIHKCFINCSIFSWKNSYLFWNHQTLKPSEKQYHLNLIEKNFKKIIKNTIRDIIPIEEILEQLNNNEEEKEVEEVKKNKEEVEEDEDEEEEEAEEEEEEEEEEAEEEEDEEEVDEEEAKNEEEVDEEDKEEEDKEEEVEEVEEVEDKEEKEENDKKVVEEENDEYNDLKNIDLSFSDNSDDESIEENTDELKKIDFQKPKNAFF